MRALRIAAVDYASGRLVKPMIGPYPFALSTIRLRIWANCVQYTEPPRLNNRPLLRGVDRVEEQPEGGVRLAAMLRPETEQHRAALARLHFHHRAFAGDRLLAFEPAAHQHVAVSETRDDARRRGARLGRGSRGEVVSGGEAA